MCLANTQWSRTVKYVALKPEDKIVLKNAIDVTERLYLKGIQEVGAALRTDDGTIFTGIHFESSTGFATICGEVTAMSCMVSGGKRDLNSIAAVWKDEEGNYFLLPPCGRCREVIADFNPKAWVIISKHADHWDKGAIEHPVKVQIGELLPLKSHILQNYT